MSLNLFRVNTWKWKNRTPKAKGLNQNRCTHGFREKEIFRISLKRSLWSSTAILLKEKKKRKVKNEVSLPISPSDP